jgi:hypothetical protein
MRPSRRRKPRCRSALIEVLLRPARPQLRGLFRGLFQKSHKKSPVFSSVYVYSAKPSCAPLSKSPSFCIARFDIQCTENMNLSMSGERVRSCRFVDSRKICRPSCWPLAGRRFQKANNWGRGMARKTHGHRYQERQARRAARMSGNSMRSSSGAAWPPSTRSKY